MTGSLPFGSTEVPVPGFGAMGLSAAMGSNLSFEEAEPVLLKAVELGCTFWDTAVRLSAKYGWQEAFENQELTVARYHLTRSRTEMVPTRSCSATS